MKNNKKNNKKNMDKKNMNDLEEAHFKIWSARERAKLWTKGNIYGEKKENTDEKQIDEEMSVLYRGKGTESTGIAKSAWLLDAESQVQRSTRSK